MKLSQTANGAIDRAQEIVGVLPVFVPLPRRPSRASLPRVTVCSDAAILAGRRSQTFSPEAR
jgi:hypothetical protein